MNLVGNIIILDRHEQCGHFQLGYSAASLNEDLYRRNFNDPEGTVMYDRNELGPEMDITMAAKRLLRGKR